MNWNLIKCIDVIITQSYFFQALSTDYSIFKGLRTQDKLQCVELHFNSYMLNYIMKTSKSKLQIKTKILAMGTKVIMSAKYHLVPFPYEEFLFLFDVFIIFLH